MQSPDVIVRKVVFGMAKNPSSRLWQKLFNHNCLLLNERAILIARFIIVLTNSWFISLRPDAQGVIKQFPHLSAPFFS